MAIELAKPISTHEDFEVWSEWPSTRFVEIPFLDDHPPFGARYKVSSFDRCWRESILDGIISGQVRTSMEPGFSRKKLRDMVDELYRQLNHIARMVQSQFGNPEHGNFRDPFLESLFILLTWRNKIDCANEILSSLRKRFGSPLHLLELDSREQLIEITGRAGFSNKRPYMIIELIDAFISRFPDGDTSIMREWDDDDIVEFLITIPGIGYKSALCVLMYSLGRDRFPIDAHIRRIIRRLGVLDDFLDGELDMEHRPFQARVEPFIPPSLRKVLHVGLLALGKTYCKPSRPLCLECPIRKSCRFHRDEAVREAEGERYTIIDLFCGAGGFSQGFSGKGFRTILAIDNDGNATRTFRLNHPSTPMGNVLTKNLENFKPMTSKKEMRNWSEYLKPGMIDVITAGIPCQGFSKAGYRTRPGMKYEILQDPRNHLYKIIIEWARKFKPRYVVIENVPEFCSAGNNDKNILSELIKDLDELNYSTDYNIVNAADFGVAQTRRRLILIASRSDSPPVQVVELENYHCNKKNLIAAIGDLPSINSDGGCWYMNSNEKVVTGHRARYNNLDDLEIFAALQPGERYINFIKRREDIMEKRRKNPERKVYSTSSFKDKYHKLISDECSRTIVAHLQRDGNGYIHPEQDRSITPREAARIQGFNDNFIFTGTQGVQFSQIGNAIPPPLTGAIARLLHARLEEI